MFWKYVVRKLFKDEMDRIFVNFFWFAVCLGGNPILTIIYET